MHLEGSAEAAPRGGGEARTKGAAVLGDAALALSFVLGALRGDSALAIPRKRPTLSVVGGGGGGRCAPQTTIAPNPARHDPIMTRAAVRSG